MQDYARSLGDAVKRARGKLDLTQNEVADAAGIDSRTVLNMQIPQVTTVCRLCSIKGGDKHDLLTAA